MRHTHWRAWNIARNTEKCGKGEQHTGRPGIWRENWNPWKMRHKHCMTWNMARNTEKGGK